MRIVREAVIDGLAARPSTHSVKVTMQVAEPRGYSHMIVTTEEAQGLSFGQRVSLVLETGDDDA